MDGSAFARVPRKDSPGEGTCLGSDRLVFSVGQDAWLWDRILAIFICQDRRLALSIQIFEPWGEFMLAIQHIVVGHDLTRMRRHPPHAGDDASFDTAFDFVVGKVDPDGVD